MEITLLIPKNAMRILKLVVPKKAVRHNHDGINFRVHQGVLYAEATNGHVAVRVPIGSSFKSSTVLGSTSTKPQETTDGFYEVLTSSLQQSGFADISRVLPYEPSVAMVPVAPNIDVQYHLNTIKMTGSKSTLPLKWESVDGDRESIHYFFHKDFHIAVGAVRL